MGYGVNIMKITILFLLLASFNLIAVEKNDLKETKECISLLLAPVLKEQRPILMCYIDTEKDYTVCKCNNIIFYKSDTGNIWR